MRIWFAGVVLLAISARAEDIHFPAPGAPYAAARATLLKQGLVIAPRRIGHRDHTFHELECDPTWMWHDQCRAIFQFRQADGWLRYARVFVATSDKRVTDAGYPAPIEGLWSVPPPIAADMPSIRGSYLAARKTLRAWGYKPATSGFGPAAYCLDTLCKKLGDLPEAECATDAPLCNAYWKGPQGRILKIETIGESNLQIRFMSWADANELRDFERKP
jgi:hypothetical protein